MKTLIDSWEHIIRSLLGKDTIWVRKKIPAEGKDYKVVDNHKIKWLTIPDTHCSCFTVLDSHLPKWVTETEWL